MGRAITKRVCINNVQLRVIEPIARNDVHLFIVWCSCLSHELHLADVRPISYFLDAATHLYKMVRPSVRRSARLPVGRSVPCIQKSSKFVV